MNEVGATELWLLHVGLNICPRIFVFPASDPEPRSFLIVLRPAIFHVYGGFAESYTDHAGRWVAILPQDGLLNDVL
jgi:hypothetical protein